MLERDKEQAILICRNTERGIKIQILTIYLKNIYNVKILFYVCLLSTIIIENVMRISF